MNRVTVDNKFDEKTINNINHYECYNLIHYFVAQPGMIAIQRPIVKKSINAEMNLFNGNVCNFLTSVSQYDNY